MHLESCCILIPVAFYSSLHLDPRYILILVATDKDAMDEDVMDEDATDKDATDEDAAEEDATDEDATDVNVHIMSYLYLS